MSAIVGIYNTIAAIDLQYWANGTEDHIVLAWGADRGRYHTS
jgi:hypothetical protein